MERRDVLRVCLKLPAALSTACVLEHTVQHTALAAEPKTAPANNRWLNRARELSLVLPGLQGVENVSVSSYSYSDDAVVATADMLAFNKSKPLFTTYEPAFFFGPSRLFNGNERIELPTLSANLYTAERFQKLTTGVANLEPKFWRYHPNDKKAALLDKNGTAGMLIPLRIPNSEDFCVFVFSHGSSDSWLQQGSIVSAFSLVVDGEPHLSVVYPTRDPYDASPDKPEYDKLGVIITDYFGNIVGYSMAPLHHYENHHPRPRPFGSSPVGKA